MSQEEPWKTKDKLGRARRSNEKPGIARRSQSEQRECKKSFGLKLARWAQNAKISIGFKRLNSFNFGSRT
jgi:hypothetical protein